MSGTITLKPILNQAALVVEHEHKTLVIADLHLGIEAEFRQKGINIGSQTEKLLERAITCVKVAEPDVIILLGDVKHAVPQISFVDRKEVPFFLAELAVYAPIYVVKGNHDGYLNKLLPDLSESVRKHEIVIKSAQGFLFDQVGYAHGHSWPSPELFAAPYILIGHNHPRIRLVSSNTPYRSMKPVWIRAHFDYDAVKRHYTEVMMNDRNAPRVIIMPAFNELCGGVAFNAANKELLGPIASKLLRLESMEAYLLDGTYIGKVGDLEKKIAV
ncbi:MAG: metallophosphoesterase [Methanophagales archaeon ANME-1-THS]|nr:MAG: metallophosphoesterase [Methanophagales archaeon ANME-1-THS]